MSSDRQTVVSADSTLRTISQHLTDSHEFVRKVLGNMTGLSRNCAVRLLCNSDPARPDYLIEMLIYDEEEGEVVTHHQPLAVISGKTHRQISDDWRRLYSSSEMTFAEVQELLGDLCPSAKRIKEKRIKSSIR